MGWISFFLLLLLLGFQSQTGIRGEVTTYYSDGEYHDTDLQVSRGKNLLADGTSLTAYGLRQGFLLQSLHEMAIDPNSKSLFLVEQETDHIVKLDSSGRPLWNIRSYGRGPGELTWPYSMKVRNGKLYIFDIQQRKISMYSLDGKFLRDVVPQPVASYQDFEVTSEGHIIIPNLYSQNYDGALFLLFNEQGEKIGQFGDNNIVQKDLNASGRIPSADLDLSETGRLVLSFNTPGTCYVYDIYEHKLLHAISIQRGPEWKAHVQREAEKNLRGYPIRIRDICIDSKGNLIIAWGGRFKDKITVGMRFGAEGEFLGRIFSNEQLQNVPSQMVMVNDSTLWVQDPVRNQLFRTHLRPFHGKE